MIYLFDQEMAKARISYFAEYEGGRCVFTIWVEEKSLAEVQRIRDQLWPPYCRNRPTRFTGRWYEIKPGRLTKTYKNHPWVFARYEESASDRDDGLSYFAFLFRNRERTVFGIEEWIGINAFVHQDVLVKMAHRIVINSRYRRQFISEDPDLLDMWKRH